MSVPFTNYTTKSYTANVKDAVDQYINGLIDGDFWKHVNEPQIFNINDITTDSLLLKYYPILQIISVTDNITADTADDDSGPELLDALNYEFDDKAGILYLINTHAASTTGLIYFSEGPQNVEIEFDWGFDDVPTDVIRFADANADRINDAINAGTASGNKISERIGNYSYRYDISKTLDGKYAHLANWETAFIRKYKRVI